MEINETKPLIVIAGATACGKTAASIELAKAISGEVISADSMQIYKYMNIGTAKPTPEEMQNIPHYLIDELYPDEEYSVAEFQRKAKAHMKEIWSQGKIPIIAGGTGFYINALINDNNFTQVAADQKLRDGLFTFAKENGNTALHERLKQIDPEAAAAIHENNIKRVVRAIEYYTQTSQKISLHNKVEKNKVSAYNAIIILLEKDRGNLYEGINSRVDIMIKNGLVSEVEGLLAAGYAPGLVSMQGLGYKEIVKYITGEYTLAQAIDELKKGTRHFAKRQLTWFKRQCSGVWLDAGEFTAKQVAGQVIYFIKNREEYYRRVYHGKKQH